MPRISTIAVRLSGDLGDFVASNVGEASTYQNVGECIRDLIRRDKERVEREAFDRLTAELAHAFSMPDATYRQLTASEVIARNQT